MKRITKIGSVFVCLLSWTVLGQGTFVVVPNNLATLEGNSSTSEPFTSSSFRFQQVYNASQFAVPPGGYLRIDGIGFRLDGASTEDVSMFFGGSSVVLSTTSRGPDSLSPVFADNTGANAVTVWNGAVSFGGVAEPGTSPQPWPFLGTMPVTSEFFYVPAHGNLLLDIIAGSGQAFLPGALDAHIISGDSISRVYANSFAATTGTTDTIGLATRFQVTIIPEPAATLLIAIVLIAAILFQRRKNGSS